MKPTRKVRAASWRAIIGVAMLASAVVAEMSQPSLAAAAVPAPGVPSAIAATGRPVSITLITGDRVDFDSTGRFRRFVRRPSAPTMGYTVRVAGGQTTVVPLDALSAIAGGAVDEQLFNVTRLAEFGFDDDRRSSIPTIMTGSAVAARAAVPPSFTPGAVLGSIGATAGTVDKASASVFWDSVLSSVTAAPGARAVGAPKLWLDGMARMSLDQSVPMIGAPTAWERGLTGRGVTVAVLDSGLDMTHPDFTGRVGAFANFVADLETDDDLVGHGTHVASIVAGSGAASDGKYRGVAPDANLVIGKVCNLDFCPFSAIIAGMEWAAVEQQAGVINMSLGGWNDAGLDPLEQAVEELSASTGALFVVAAGNDYCGLRSTVGSPATAPSALAVGAVGRDGLVADFSSCGPSADNAAAKPEITAPGVDIVAARAADGIFPPNADNPSYTTLSGTSMATPHVAGAAALLAQQHPDWTGAQLKAALVGTARPTDPEAVLARQGAGLVDLVAATDRTWFADSGNVTFGVQLWPHQDDEVLRATVTYRNDSATARQIDLGLDVRDEAGEREATGMFSLSSPQLSLPAFGSATVEVVADSRVPADDGVYTARLLAVSGTETATTLISIEREVESYDLQLSAIDHDDRPATERVLILTQIDDWSVGGFFDIPAEGTTVRIPKGEYLALAMNINEEFREVDALVSFGFVVDAPARHRFDFRRTKRVTGKILDMTTLPLATFSRWNIPAGPIGTGADAGDGVLRIAPLRSRQPRVADATTVVKLLGVPNDPSAALTTAAMTAEVISGVVPAGFTRTYGRDTLTTTKILVPPSVGPDFDRVVWDMSSIEHDPIGWAPGSSGGRDGVFTVFHNEGPANRWQASVEYRSNTGLADAVEVRSYAVPTRLGTTRTESFRNTGPFGPALDPTTGYGPMARVADRGKQVFSLTAQLGDRRGSTVLSYNAETTATLSVDGSVVATGTSTAPWFGWRVPSATGRYRLTVESKTPPVIGPILGLPSTTKTQWSFDLATPPGDEWEVLPLSYVRFAAPTRTTGASSPARSITLPFSVFRQADVKAVPDQVKSVEAEVSFNRGDTWSRAEVRGSGSKWSILTGQVPAGASVSVRVTVRSLDGGKVVERIVDLLNASAVTSLVG